MRQKVLTAKRTALVITALIFALALSAIVAFGANTKTARAAEGDPVTPSTVTLAGESDYTFNSRKTMINGISDTGLAKIVSGTTRVVLDIPSNIEGLTTVSISGNTFLNYEALFTEPDYEVLDIRMQLPSDITSVSAACLRAVGEYIKEIAVAEDNQTYRSIDDSCLVEKASNKLVATVRSRTEIPDTVTALGAYAFYGKEIENLAVPASVTSGLFDALEITTVTSITIDPENTVYGLDNGFVTEKDANGNAVDFFVTAAAIKDGKITVPDAFTSIPASAFSDLDATEIVIPETVTSIADGAFSGCYKLETLTLPFIGKTKNAEIAKDAQFAVIFGTEYSVGGFRAYEGLSTNLNGTRYIPISLKTVTITGSGIKLFDYAFYDVAKTQIETLNMADDVELVGNNVFNTQYNSVSTNSFYKLKAGQDYATVGKIIIAVSTDIKSNRTYCVPEGTPAILENAFTGADFVEIVLPQSLKYIGENAFDGCTKLINVYNLSDLELTKGEVTNGKVAYYAQNIYDTFTKFAIVTDGDYTFLNGENPVLLSYTGSEDNLSLPENFNGKNYSIGESAFEGNTAVKKLVIPANSVTDIGAGAFRNCSGITELTIGEGVDNFGESAFEGCSSLETVTINGCNNIIGDACFKDCSSLITVDYGKEVNITEIGNRAFENCTSLNAIAVPASVITIGDYAYFHCESAVNFSIGNKVEHIGALAFANCTSLTGEVRIPASVKTVNATYANEIASLGDGLFANDAKITSAVIEGQCPMLRYTFQGCASLVSARFDSAAIEQLIGVFRGCSSMESVVLPEGIQYMNALFSGVNNLKSLTVPVGALPESVMEETASRGYWIMGNPSGEVFQGLNVVFPAADGVDNYGMRVAEFIKWFDYDSAARGNGSLADTPPQSGNPPYAERKDWIYLNSVMFILPDEQAYNAVLDAMTQEWYDGFSTDRIVCSHFPFTDFKAKLFYQTQVTYEAYKPDGTTLLDSVKVTKLARSDAYGGADIRYTFTTDESGAKYYAIDESYTFPAAVGAYATEANAWKQGENAVENLDNILLTGPITFKNTLSVIKISIDSEFAATYNGKAWTLPKEYEGVAAITAVNGNTENLEAIGADTYTITVTASGDYVFTDGSKTATVTLVIEKARAEIVWKLSNGTTVKANEIPEIEYTGNNIYNSLSVTFADVNGNTVSVPFGNVLRYFNDTASTSTPSAVGIWRFELIDSVYDDYEFTHGSQQFRITPQSVELSETVKEMAWLLSEQQSDLLDETIYVYNLNGTYHYLTAQTNASGYTLVEVITVKNAVARWRGDTTDLAVDIKNKGGYDFEIENAEGYDNTERAKGVHTAVFTFTADDNHVFTLNRNAELNGIAVSVNGNVATVSKTWYIVEIANDLVLNATTDYVITGWTFGGTVPAVSVPVLINNDVTSDKYGTSDDKVSFILKRNGAQVGEKFYRSNFDYYINGSMPAGEYVLEATVETYSLSGVVQTGFTRNFPFTVENADIAFGLTATANGYAAYEWEYNADGRGNFFNGFTAALTQPTAKVTLTTVAYAGYWNTEAGKAYYGGYTVTYNFARLNTDEYVAANALSDEIKSGTNATYIVYFEITAPNHNNITETGDSRYDFFFTVTVYEVIDAPDVNNVTYTGVKVLPTITDDENGDKYEIIWDAASVDTYVNGGTHGVSLKLHDDVHYRWKDTEGDTVKVQFTIEKATNTWTKYPDIIGWAYGSYNDTDNRIIAMPQFADSGEVVTFYISTDEKGDNKVEGLTAITVDADGKIMDADGKIKAALNKLDNGTYYLNASLPATNNYLQLTATGRSFEITQIVNEWNVTLGITTWVEGRYDELEEFPIAVDPKYGEAIIKIVDANNAEKVYYEGANGTDELKEVLANLEVGSYLLTATVAASADGNYSALVAEPVLFQVFEKPGLPWWAILLIVIGSLGVAALVLWILHEKGVLQMLTGKIVIALRTRMTVDATIAAVRANKRAEESRRSIAKAEAQDRIEAMRKAREEEKAKPPEERAAALEEKAAAEAARAEKAQQRAEKLKKRAQRLKGGDATETTEAPDTLDLNESEAAATETPTNNSDE